MRRSPCIVWIASTQRDIMATVLQVRGKGRYINPVSRTSCSSVKHHTSHPFLCKTIHNLSNAEIYLKFSIFPHQPCPRESFLEVGFPAST